MLTRKILFYLTFFRLGLNLLSLLLYLSNSLSTNSLTEKFSTLNCQHQSFDEASTFATLLTTSNASDLNNISFNSAPNYVNNSFIAEYMTRPADQNTNYRMNNNTQDYGGDTIILSNNRIRPFPKDVLTIGGCFTPPPIFI